MRLEAKLPRDRSQFKYAFRAAVRALLERNMLMQGDAALTHKAYSEWHIQRADQWIKRCRAMARWQRISFRMPSGTRTY